jgi:acetate kinase
VLLYLLEQGWDHDRLQTLLYRQSGLLGVSGISADMRRLRADAGAAARQAIEQFTYRVVRESGALTACIGGLDVLAFSGGIGEHDAALRADVCAGLGYLGVRMDEARNRQASGDAVMPIHAQGSTVQVWVVPTDEGSVAAAEAARLIAQG